VKYPEGASAGQRVFLHWVEDMQQADDASIFDVIQ